MQYTISWVKITHKHAGWYKHAGDKVEAFSSKELILCTWENDSHLKILRETIWTVDKTNISYEMRARHSFCTFVKMLKKIYKKMKGFKQASWTLEDIHKETQQLYS